MLKSAQLASLLAAALVLIGCAANGSTEEADGAVDPPSAMDSGASNLTPQEIPSTPTVHTGNPTPKAVLSSPTSSTGADADVKFVRAVQSVDGTWTFHVTVEHPDTGWQDYVDGWDVVTPEGEVIKPDPESHFTRLLLHPHVNEQPFTRSQSDIAIPVGVSQVTVRAHDILDGFGGGEVVVDLSADSGEDFEVERRP